jgi:hypothetical protein
MPFHEPLDEIQYSMHPRGPSPKPANVPNPHVHARLRLAAKVRLEHAVPVREPLVLISQIQRSGGTLLLQLFDGHRQCHVDPYELKIGHPKKHNWPPLDLSRPETWFETLYFRGARMEGVSHSYFDGEADHCLSER